MTMDQLMSTVLAIMPEAIFDEDDDGEITISTGLFSVGDESTQLLHRTEV